MSKSAFRTFLLDLLSWIPVPLALWQKASDLIHALILHRKPNKALRQLLIEDARLQSMISYVGMRYEGGLHPKHRLMKYHDFFTSRISANERILDIGCGYGEVAYSIAQITGAKVLGIDIDPDKIHGAQQRQIDDKLTFKLADATQNLGNETFDTVIISNCLEHIEHRVEFINHCQTKVSAQRWLIRIPCFDRDWKVPLREELGLFPYCDDTHFTEYTMASFKAEMAACNMNIAHASVQWGEIWAEVKPRSVAAN